MIKEFIKKVFPHGAFMYRFLGTRLILLYSSSIIVGSLDAVGISFIYPLLNLLSLQNDTKTEALKSNDFIWRIIDFIHLPRTVAALILFTISVFLFKGFGKFLQGYYKLYLRAVFIRKLREKMIKGLINLKYQSFINFNAGKITNSFTTETMQVSGAFIFYNSAIISLITVVAYLSYSVFLSPIFTAVAVLSGGLISLFMSRLTSSTKKQSIQLAEYNGIFSSLLIQSIYAYKYLKITGFNDNFRKKILGNVSFLQEKMTRIGLNISLGVSIREPITISIILLVIVIQVNYFHEPVGSIIIALFLFYRALNEIVIFQTNWQNFISQYGSFDSVKEMLNTLANDKEVIHKKEQIIYNKSINLSEVSFSFTEGGKKIIDNISLSITKNSSVAFVGESGAGKTTIVDLITGLMQPQQGEILIDGMPLENNHLMSWRNKIGYISQDQTVFNDTLANNISLWDTSESREEIESKISSAILKSHCEAFVNKLPEGMHTQIGDRGVSLSGGQKQRLSIARELYKNTELLILDEATSALDTESERTIQANIDELKGQVTLIVIAHRLSTVKNVDCIFVMKDGKIIESGGYNELSQNINSEFYKMVNLQSL
ncbi:MAG: ABC transporter ATP-binding protein [Bacteroidetes bacterium]|nr:ABC transporter ATP-binding protein [Bacteroidota bacterium]